MQRPTCTGLRIRSPSDAQVIFHAVSMNILPMVSRRLDTEERRSISSGCVFVWEERGPNAEATGLGIERWTDGIRWGPSRVRDEFLFYNEKHEPADVEVTSDSDNPFTSHARPAPSQGILRDNLVKQTYSVFVDTPKGKRKWHLIAYFTQDSLDYLQSIDDIPQLATLSVPRGMYKSARSAKRHRDDHATDPSILAGLYGVPSPYPPYTSGPHSGILPSHPHYHSSLSDSSSAHNGGRLPQNSSQILAPLAYLQNIPPPRRHPLDEKALMSFSPGLTLILP